MSHLARPFGRFSGCFRGLAALVASAALAGCLTGGDSSPGDGGSDGGVEGVRPMFEEAVLTDPATGFFDFPFPSALRTDAVGHPVLDGFPGNAPLLASAVDIVEAERPGFSGGGTVYFRFDGALDPSSLPASAADSTSDVSTVWVLDIDPDSPTHGRRVPATVTYRPMMDTFWPGDVVTVRPVPGLTMRPGTRHAVVVRTGVRASDGSAVLPQPAFEVLKEPDATGAVADHYADVFTELESLGLPRDDILVATAFTTGDPAIEMDGLRAAMHEMPLPTPTGWTELASAAGHTTYGGTFTTYEFFDGPGPYDQSFGYGAFQFDETGQPLDMSARDVPFAITVPTSPMPVDGYPISVYGHGTGGSERSHTWSGREGPSVAGEGVAMVGFEAALHGTRADGLESVESLLFSNPIAAREMVRQTVADMMLLYRMIGAGALNVPASVTGETEVTFATDPVLYMGHSQGSQEAGLLLGVEPTIDAAFLSEGGAGSLIAIFDREFEGTPISCLVAVAAGIVDCPSFTPDHPAAWVVQALLDPADPLSFTHRFHRERLETESAPSIYMTEGTADPATPPRSIEALAVAIGLPQVSPVYMTTLPYELVSWPVETAPVQGNLTLPGGRAVTGGLMQWDGAGHFVIYDFPDGRDAYVEWFRSALTGLPVMAAR